MLQSALFHIPYAQALYSLESVCALPTPISANDPICHQPLPQKNKLAAASTATTDRAGNHPAVSAGRGGRQPPSPPTLCANDSPLRPELCRHVAQKARTGAVVARPVAAGPPREHAFGGVTVDEEGYWATDQPRAYE